MEIFNRITLNRLVSFSLVFYFTGFVSADAQNVGIGTAAPSQKLDVIGNIRSSTLAGFGNRGVFADPTGTLFANTGSGYPDWQIVGNTGTVAGTNFIGTTDAIDFVTKTGGTAATNERIRVFSSGPVSINCATTQAGDVLGVYGTGYAGTINAANNFAINGYVNSNVGAAVFAENQAAYAAGVGNAFAVWGANSNAGSGTGVFGVGAGTVAGSNGVWGQYNGTSATGVGVRGQANGDAIGVAGFTSGALAIGVLGQNTSATGIGVEGVNTGAAGAGVVGFTNAGGDALYGQSTNVNGFAAWGINTAAANTGHGVVGMGGNTVSFTLVATGTGGAFTGRKIGCTGFVAPDSLIASTTTSAGGYFYCNSGAYGYVGARVSSTNYKIIGAGTVSTVVKDLNNHDRIMAAPESPEILFQDFGTGQLVNGTAHVNIDPVFSKNIIVDASHPLRVFVQLNGNCNGVYVYNRTQNSFDVKELNNGNSNVEFTWFISANRADEVDVNGNLISQNANNRFVPFTNSNSFVKRDPARMKTVSIHEEMTAPVSANKNK